MRIREAEVEAVYRRMHKSFFGNFSKNQIFLKFDQTSKIVLSGVYLKFRKNSSDLDSTGSPELPEKISASPDFSSSSYGQKGEGM